MLSAAVVAGSSLALGACGNGQTIHTPTGTVHVHGNSHKVTITNSYGTATFSKARSGSSTSLPSGFPKASVPLPAGGRITGAETQNIHGKTSWEVVMKFNRSPGSVLASYAKQLKAKGFQETLFSGSSSGGIGVFRSAQWSVSASAAGKHTLTLLVAGLPPVGTSSSSGS